MKITVNSFNLDYPESIPLFKREGVVDEPHIIKVTFDSEGRYPYNSHPFREEKSAGGTEIFFDENLVKDIVSQRGHTLKFSTPYYIWIKQNEVPVRESATLDYSPDAVVTTRNVFDWQGNNEQVNLTVGSNSQPYDLGRVVSRGGTAGSEVVLQVVALRTDSSVAPKESDGNFFRLDGNLPESTSLLPDGTLRLTFPPVPAGQFVLRISGEDVLRERIGMLLVCSDEGEDTPCSVQFYLPEIQRTTRVKLLPFRPEQGLKISDEKIRVPYEPRIVRLGYISMQINAAPDDHFLLSGKLINGGGQKRQPFDLTRGDVGVKVDRTALERHDTKAAERRFSVERVENAMTETLTDGYTQRYDYELPLILNLEDVDFTRSENGDVMLSCTVELAGEHQDIAVVVEGSTIARLIKKSSRNAEEFEVTLRSDQRIRPVGLEEIRLRNARTWTDREDVDVSVCLRNIRLTNVETGQSETGWDLNVQVKPYRGKVVERKNATAVKLPILQAREYHEITFDLIREQNLPTHSTGLIFHLDYEVVSIIHARSAHPEAEDWYTHPSVDREQRRLTLRIIPHVPRTFISIDLGTSAIVAALADNDQHDFKFEFLNLQHRLKELREAANFDYLEALQPERGTHFISSNLLLNTNRKVDAKTLPDSMLTIAPPLASILKRPNAWLPNIKMIFGSSGIASLEKEFGKEFGFFLKNTKYTVPAGGEVVVKQTLYALIQLLLQAFIREHSTFKKRHDHQLQIVFTVPNNFNKSYREEITKWAREERDGANPGLEVHFISESDAVSYSYVDFWPSLNPGRDVKKTETILTYDIGAGTVDLSLSTRRLSRNDAGVYELLVQGRVGLPKAGNYLDYILARIVWDQHGSESDDPYFTNFDPFGPNRKIQETLGFHDWVRNVLKPAIGRVREEEWVNTLNVIPLPLEAGFVREAAEKKRIDLFFIITSPRFKEYLDTIAAKAIDRLVYNAYGGHRKPVIDTVLFSGRTIQMNIIKERVMKELNLVREKNKSPLREIYVNNWDMGGLVESSSKLKGLVALGGIRYLRNYRDQDENEVRYVLRDAQINAAYGLFFDLNETGTTSEYDYQEIVHPCSFRGVGETHKVYLQTKSARRLWLVQTYESTPGEIEKTFEDGIFSGDFTVDIRNGEPIELAHFLQQGETLGEASVEIDEQNRLVLRLFNQRGGQVERLIIENYRRGYNTSNLDARRGLWPFANPTNS